MAMQGTVDNLASKPKFPKERTEKGLVFLNTNAAAVFPTSTLVFTGANTNGVANGWVANGVGIGNTSGTIGFNLTGPYVVNVSGNTITLSQSISANIASGNVISFSKPISYKIKTAGNGSLNVQTTILAPNSYGYNANTFLVNSSRMTNANSVLISSLFHTNANETSVIAHQGWVLVTPQTGYVKSAIASPAGNGYANGYVTITANSLFSTAAGSGSGANVAYTVNSNGSIVSLSVNANGNNYILTPGVSLPSLTDGHSYISNVYVFAANTGNGGNVVNGYLVITSVGNVGSGANVSYTVNSTGAIVNSAIVIHSIGGGYDGNVQNVIVTASGSPTPLFGVVESLGANATVLLTMGGRANRILTEVLSVANNINIADQNSGGQWFPGR